MSHSPTPVVLSTEKPWVEHFEVSLDDYSGFVSTKSTALTLIREYEVATTSAFVVTKQTKGFGDRCMKGKNYRIFWKDTQDVKGVRLEYDGIPFIILGKQVLECRHGPDRNKALKARNFDNKERDRAGDHNYSSRRGKSRRILQNTVKFDCPASIILREIIKFPNFKIEENTKNRRENASTCLRTDLENDAETMGQEYRIYVSLPDPNNHDSHVVGQGNGLMQTVDDEIIKRIYELVGEGVCSVSEMKRHLQLFVKSQMFARRTPPDNNNRRFYPTKTDIRNHMYRANQSQRFSKIDQEDVQCKLEEWQRENTEDSFFFRPCTEQGDEASHETNDSYDDGEDDFNDDIEITGRDEESTDVSTSFLFIHQTKWQKLMLLRYVGKSTSTL